MSEIRQAVFGRHASANTVYHCLYAYYFLGYSKVQLAKVYAKSHATISNWISRYEQKGYFSRKEREKVYLRFNQVQRKWIIDLYERNPVLLLDEAKQQFEAIFSITISAASICRILHAEGFSYKGLERRAIQLRESDVIRFVEELSIVAWDLHALVFLDEVSCDNRGILRNKGYAKIGERIIYRGEFCRRPRVSMLSFMGQTGMLETFWTEGTFNRTRFFECCRSFATSGNVQRHSGQHSVWILDGARIHCHKKIIEYLRSLGIQVIFLPAYAPFFNPIEYLFGYLKRYLKRQYVENSKKDLTAVIAEGLLRYKNFDCTAVMGRCGYLPGGSFDPSIGLGQNVKTFGFVGGME